MEEQETHGNEWLNVAVKSENSLSSSGLVAVGDFRCAVDLR